VRLFTPGPVEIPQRILRALSQVPPHHRTDVFRATMLRVGEALRELHETKGEVFVLAASGTGAMEAAVVNLMSPGERAIVIVGGKFGERWKNLLQTYGVPHTALDCEWGRALEPSVLAAALERDAAATTVFVTHSETSTGSLHDVQAFAKLTRARGKRLVVDAITSLGVHPLPQDAWGVDVIVCGSQKGLMTPPGIATLSLAPWAAGAIDGGMPRHYFDLRKARKLLATGETPFTPAVSLVLALEEALAMIREEGLDHVHHRHRQLAHAMRAGAQAIGFRLFAANPSHAVTACATCTAWWSRAGRIT
jgi:aspartate aminotransferase-like enzyme